MRKQNLIQTLAANTAPWLSGADSEDPVALGCSVVLRRNLVDLPFPSCASDIQLRRVQLHIAEAVAETDLIAGGWSLDLTQLSSLERLILFERRVSQLNPAVPAEGCAIFMNEAQTRLVSSNESDHLCIQGLQPGAALWELYKDVAELDTQLASQLEYVWDPHLGYLTARPDSVGTGMRAGVILHLPGLLLAEQIDQLAAAVDEMHMSIRSVFVNDDEACGNLFEIANRSTLGESAESLVQRLCRVTSDVIMQERRARQLVLQEKSQAVYDYISRGYALLRYAYRLDSSETVNLLSAVRLGIDLGMLPTVDCRTIDQLTLLSQSGHLQSYLGRSMERDERNGVRAELMREMLVNADKV